MLFIEQTGQCTSLSDGIEVKGLPRALEHIDELFVRDTVADASAREALDLREGA